VIICTYRRPDVAARCVEAVLPQLGPGDRCLVVAQGDQVELDETRSAILQLSGVNEEALSVLEQIRPSRTVARNRGLLESDTDLVVYLDDDCVVRPGWLRALLLPLEEGRADLVAGRLYEDPDLTTNAPRRTGAVITSTGHTRRNFNTGRSGSSGLAPGGNMAVRRELAVRAGGFDPAIWRGAALYEDSEFSERLRQLGARIMYAGEPAVDHLAVRTGEWWNRDQVSWEADRSRHMSLLFRRHRPMRWPVMAATHILVVCLKILSGQLPARTLPCVITGLIEGRRDGGIVLPPLTESTEVI